MTLCGARVPLGKHPIVFVLPQFTLNFIQSINHPTINYAPSVMRCPGSSQLQWFCMNDMSVTLERFALILVNIQRGNTMNLNVCSDSSSGWVLGWKCLLQGGPAVDTRLQFLFCCYLFWGHATVQLSKCCGAFFSCFTRLKCRWSVRVFAIVKALGFWSLVWQASRSLWNVTTNPQIWLSPRAWSYVNEGWHTYTHAQNNFKWTTDKNRPTRRSNRSKTVWSNGLRSLDSQGQSLKRAFTFQSSPCILLGWGPPKMKGNQQDIGRCQRFIEETQSAQWVIHSTEAQTKIARIAFTTISCGVVSPWQWNHIAMRGTLGLHVSDPLQYWTSPTWIHRMPLQTLQTPIKSFGLVACRPHNRFRQPRNKLNETYLLHLCHCGTSGERSFRHPLQLLGHKDWA